MIEKGGANEEKLAFIGKLNPAELAQLRAVYQQKFSKDISEVIDKTCKGRFKIAAMCLFKDPLSLDVDYICLCLQNNIGSVMEMVLTKSNQQKDMIKLSYQERHKKSLAGAIADHLSGKERELLLNLVEPRSENPADPALVAQDAQALYHACEGKTFGCEEKPFIELLSTRSWPHIAAIVQKYPEVSKKHRALLDVVEKEFSGNLRNGLAAIVLLATFGLMDLSALVVNVACKDGNQDTLTRVILINRGPNMEQLKNYYRQKYSGHTLKEDVFKAISDKDLRELLLNCVGDT